MKPGFFTVLKWAGFPVEKAKEIFNNAQIADKTSWQTYKKWEIFKFHYKNNEFYRNFVGKEFTNWNDIPVLNRKDLRSNFLSKIPSALKSHKLYKNCTSGSSGYPLHFARDPLTHALVWENVHYLYNQTGTSLDEKQARMFGMKKTPLEIVKARLKDWASNRYRFNMFDLSDNALDNWVKQFQKGKFHYIYGYAYSLSVFADYLISRNLTLKDISPSLKCCIITSEICSSKNTENLRLGFGVPIYNEYGSAELGIIGFQFNDYWQASDELLFLEVLDDNGNILPDGEIGILTCTSFFNKATPFIRYQLGDTASIRRINVQTQIIEVLGSMNDLAVLPSGKKVPGLSFFYIAQRVLESSDNIKEFLFRQTAEGFNFEYVADSPINNDFKIIKKYINHYLKEDIKLSAIKMDELQRGINGKSKHFISSLTN
jgi:phenylacetate-CoA ligase